MQYALKSPRCSTCIERRRSRRWVVTLGLLADIGEADIVRGYLFDVSLRGAYVVLETQEELATRAALAFQVERVPVMPQASGGIARLERYGRRTGIGIAFDDVNRAFRAFVRSLDQQSDAERLATLQTVRSLRLEVL